MRSAYSKGMKYFCLVLLVAFCGCRSLGHIKSGESDRITVGMTKAEAIKALGKPDSISSDGSKEVLTYVLERPWWQDVPFRVQLVEGRVTSFGAEERPK